MLLNCDVRARTRASILAARRGPQPSSCLCAVVTRPSRFGAKGEADGPRATHSSEPTSRPLSPREGLGDPAMSPTVHLDGALQRRLPMALTAWAERPSEGHALLGMLRGFPSSASLVHPIRHRLAQREVWRVLTSKSKPIKTPELEPPREEEPHPEDQGAFHRQQSARRGADRSALPCRIGLPSRRPRGRGIANRPATVPDGGDEPRLLMPWLGRTSAFVTDSGRLALTNEADQMARLAVLSGRDEPSPLATGLPQRP